MSKTIKVRLPAAPPSKIHRSLKNDLHDEDALNEIKEYEYMGEVKRYYCGKCYDEIDINDIAYNGICEWCYSFDPFEPDWDNIVKNKKEDAE